MSESQTAQELAAEIEALRDRQDRLEQENERLRDEIKQAVAKNDESDDGDAKTTSEDSAGLSVPSPSRRQLLKAGGVGLGALLFGSATSGSAAAASGTIGSSSQRFDFYGGAVDANAIDTEKLNTDYHFAKSYSGADPDSRLDAAISAASNGETIYLENGTYDSDRTVSKDLRFVGPSANAGATIEGTTTWTLSGICEIENVDNNGTIQINTGNCTVTQVQNFDGSINVGGDFCVVDLVQNGSVTFESGTSGGVLDTATNVSATDNGTNTIGDNA